MQGQQRILLVSYNALSKENSNGRTLEFLLGAYHPHEIAQLYFSSEKPDFDVTDKYYRVGEGRLLSALLKGGQAGGPVPPNAEGMAQRAPNKATSKKGLLRRIFSFAKRNKRFSWVKFMRNRLWQLGRRKWKNSTFRQWVQSFAPDVILTISGKNSCFHKIAVDLAKEYNLPLIVYHCEDYCLKSTKGASLAYKAYIRSLKRSMDVLMERAALAIYNSESIQALYAKYYQTPSMVAYMSTDMQPAAPRPHAGFILSYMGNLGLGRHVSLCEIGQALYRVAPEAKFYVYSAYAPPEFLERVQGLPNMEYKGFVSYAQCREVMYGSDLLIHAEGFSAQTVQNLRIAFSTKIADSLASGIPFFVYAPRGIAATEYLLSRRAACVVTDPDALEEQLRVMVFNAAVRRQYVENALEAVQENHTFEKTVSSVRQKIMQAAAQSRQSKHPEREEKN